MVCGWKGKTKDSHNGASELNGANNSVAWAVSRVIGFSHNTTLPAATAAAAHSACWSLGRAMYTASTCGSSSTPAY